MSNQLIKETQKSGMTISKEKLLESIRRSTQQSFIISQSQNSKQAVVVVPL